MNALLNVNDLRKTYPTAKGPVQAVDGVSFQVPEGKTVALVGESGCGKSTIAMSLLRLIDADSGQVTFDGMDLNAARGQTLRNLRRELGVVFQNPYGSLNPRMKVRDIVGEPLKDILGLRGRELRDRVIETLNDVGLGAEHVARYPLEFSGGQRQRIAIARALTLAPKMIVLDEPTAALDVSVQAQVLNLLKDLQIRYGLSYLFISHDLATVRFIADEILVMYLGRIVESGRIEEVFRAPGHPYTQALMAAIPSIDLSRRGQLQAPEGEIPDPTDMPAGCVFATRCAYAGDICRGQAPILAEYDSNRRLACHHPLLSEKSS